MTDGLRKAALLLHGMAPEDRVWLLDRLDQAQRVDLQALLDDLRTLGVPLDAAVALPQAVMAAPVDDSRRDTLASIYVRGAEAVARWMADEPDWVVAQLLLAARRDWRTSLLRAMEPRRRQRIETAMQAVAPLSGRLRDRLLIYIDGAMAEPASAAVPMPSKHRMRQWLRSFAPRA